MEKGEPQPEQAAVNDETRHNRRFGIALFSLVVLALIIGLSVGLTRPDNNDPNTSLSGQVNGDSTQSPTYPSPTTPTDSTNPSPTTNPSPSPPTTDPEEGQVKFQSSGRAFDVTMTLFSPAVLEGYDNENDLKTDLDQAVRFFINTFIEEQLQYKDYQLKPFGPDAESLDGGVADDQTAAMPSTGPSAEGATDFETNNQVDGVDEADLVKSDGTYVYAAYDDVLVIWEALTGTFVTNYTLPALANSASEPGFDINMGFSDSPDINMGFSDSPPWAPWVAKGNINGISLEKDRLVLYISGYGPEVVAEKAIKTACYDAFATRIMVFDTSTLPASLALITQEDIQGSFRDARAIGDNIHVVTNCGFNLWTLTEQLYYWNEDFGKMTDAEFRTAAAAKVEPLIGAFVDLMVNDITAHGPANIPKVSLWQSQVGNSPSVVERANAGGPIQAYTSLISFSVSNLSGDLQLSSAGACTPSTWGYTYSIEGWVVFAAQGWDWIEELQGTGQTTQLLGFKVDGTNASPALIGSFPGYIQNQYALSIYEGHLRVATTIDVWFTEREEVIPVDSDSGTVDGADVVDIEPAIFWPEPRSIVKNQVIILKIPTVEGEVFEEVSRIADLGEEGERITAINYFGLVAYAGKLLEDNTIEITRPLPLTSCHQSPSSELIRSMYST